MLKRFQEKSSASLQQLLENLLQSSTQGLLVLYPIRDQDNSGIVDFEMILGNEIAAELLGVAYSELLGTSLRQLSSQKFARQAIPRFQEVMARGAPAVFEQRIKTSDQKRWLRISATRLEDVVTATLQDITDLEEARQEGEVEEIKYRRLFEESLDAICLLNDQFQILEANDSCQRLFEYASQSFKGLPLSTLANDDSAYASFRQQLLDHGRAEEHEINMVTQVGAIRPCLVNGVLLLDDMEVATLFIVVIRDMTKRRKTERKALLAERLSLTGKIARTIAHEVRNPLTNLTLAVDQLKEEIGDQVEEADLYFDIVSRNVERISTLITDLLNSSRPRALQKEKQSIIAVMNEALQLVRDRLELKGIRLETTFKASAELELDADQFKVALLNLFVNAIEAMEDDQGVLTVSTWLEEEEYAIAIGDTGQGMSKEELEQLFEPYFTGKKEGTGLGLTTVQNIVRSHDASIDVESELGKGTTFHIRFKTQL